MAKLINKTKEQYTVVDMNILKNKNLGIKERGLLVTLLSLPDNWNFSVKGLTKILPDGRTTIENTLRRLEAYGYLKRYQAFSKDNKFDGYDWQVFENPVNTEGVFSFTDFPLMENPITEKPLTENLQQSNNQESNNQEFNNQLSYNPSIYHIEEDGIDRFEVIKEIKNYNKIPYSYNKYPYKMEIAIKYFACWDSYSNNEYMDIKRDAYVLAVECLIEMACERKLKNYCSCYIAYSKVIDEINNCIDYENNGLYNFLQSIIEDYVERAEKVKIKSLKNYMKSCLWNGFSSYRVKFTSHFNRTYYQKLLE